MDLDLKDPALPVSRRHSFRIGQASAVKGIDLTKEIKLIDIFVGCIILPSL